MSSPDDTISHYKILGELGRGGMGVVYKAEDTKLHRTVALKVLPAHALASEDDRSRFYREARSAAALHHAHIATVFEIDEAAAPGGETQPFIAMEFVDGETLADRIAKGPLPLKDVIRISSHVASGLQAAHGNDIVHRDVKSGNIMLTADGTAKILDFGLAKTSASTRLTQMGSTIGTAAFMSPEQARGEEVDQRTDIWSLGSVLYEMIAGRVPFPGDYEQAVVYAILNEDPEPLTALRSGVPMELERIVFKCLQKDAGRRYQNLTDLAVDLESVDLGQTTTSASTVTTGRPSGVTPAPHKKDRTMQLLFGFAVGVVATTLSIWALVPERAQDAPAVQHLHLLLPEEAPLVFVGAAPLGAGQPALALSPDGENLVYVGGSDSSTALYVRPLARNETRGLPQTEGAFAPFFSPDGQWVGFFRESTLLKIRVSGGEPLELQDVADPMGAFWDEGDVIYVSSGQGMLLQTVSADGGLIGGESRERTVDNDVAHDMVVFPGPLPRKDEILVSRRSSGTAVVSTDGRTPKELNFGGNTRYADSGHLVFTDPGRLMAVPFDLRDLAVRGSPVPVVDNLRTEVVAGAGQYTFTTDGLLVYAAGDPAERGQFVVVDRAGRETELPIAADFYGMFSLSPDGSRLAATVNQAGSSDIWVFDLERGVQQQLTKGGNYGGPVWMPDGEELIVSSFWQGRRGRIYRLDASGIGGMELIHPDDDAAGPQGAWGGSAVSPDGRWLACSDNSDLVLVDLSEGREPIVLPGDGTRKWGGRFSPDGRYLAYTSIEGSGSEVYVQPVPPNGRRWKVSSAGGEEPEWSPSGDAIYYSGNQTWYETSIVSTDPFTLDTPRLLFEGPYVNVPGIGNDVTPDGRFILLRGSGKRTTRELQVVVNWFEELKRLAPSAD